MKIFSHLLFAIAGFQALYAVEQISLEKSFYGLNAGDEIREITSRVLMEGNLPPVTRDRFQAAKRRFFVFSFPSGELQLKTMISFVDSPGPKNLLVILRKEGDMEGVPAFIYPGQELDFALASDAIIVLGNYRGGVNPGTDEYGGKDVNDVNSLTSYLPTILKKLNIEKKDACMMGPGRGGMEMMLALSRFPQLSSFYTRFVSLSGFLNLDIAAKKNTQWIANMQKHFGYKDSKDWIDQRNPILSISSIKDRHVPLLIVQGTADPILPLEEGTSMLAAMRKQGFDQVSYWEVAGGNHALENLPEYTTLILGWLFPPSSKH